MTGTHGVLWLDDPWHSRSPAIELRRADGSVERIAVEQRDPYACELEDFAAAVAGERAPRFGREDAVAQARAIAALYASAEANEPTEVQTMKTSLGIWAFGPMITRFVPGGYQPAHAYDAEPVAEKVHRAVEGLGDLIDGYEFHYPQELSHENLSDVQEALGDHDIYCIAGGLHLDPRFGRGGLVNPDEHVRAEARRIVCEGAEFAGVARREHDHLARDRGLQLPLPDALRGLVALADRGHRRGRRDLQTPRGQAVPRAQELRAGDEDPDAQHGDDDLRRQQAPRRGARQRPDQHGLAAPADERRAPARVRRAAALRGTARPPARELRLGHLRRRQHARRDRVHGDDRAGARAAPLRLRRERRTPRPRPLSLHRGSGRARSSAR